MTTTHSAVCVAVLILGGSAVLAPPDSASAAAQDRTEKQEREAGRPPKGRSLEGIPVILRLPNERSGAEQVAKEVRRFDSEYAGNQLCLPLVAPPAVNDVAKLLPAGTVAEGNTITLADGTTAVLVKVKENDGQAEVFRKAFDAATITRESLLKILKGMPRNATVRLAPPSRDSVVIEGDLERAAEAVRGAPVGTRMTVDFDHRTAQYPRLR